MELHIQKCQNCQSRDLRNILVRDESQKVFVQCRRCNQLVARYILGSGGYFHAGKEFESFLRSIERDGGSQSAKDVQQLYAETKNKVTEEFAQVLDTLNERYQNKLP